MRGVKDADEDADADAARCRQRQIDASGCRRTQVETEQSDAHGFLQSPCSVPARRWSVPGLLLTCSCSVPVPSTPSQFGFIAGRMTGRTDGSVSSCR